jgi:hypothetical protein
MTKIRFVKVKNYILGKDENGDWAGSLRLSDGKFAGATKYYKAFLEEEIRRKNL